MPHSFSRLRPACTGRWGRGGGVFNRLLSVGPRPPLFFLVPPLEETSCVFLKRQTLTHYITRRGRSKTKQIKTKNSGDLSEA